MCDFGCLFLGLISGALALADVYMAWNRKVPERFE
jgi:hypothetical protein